MNGMSGFERQAAGAQSHSSTLAPPAPARSNPARDAAKGADGFEAGAAALAPKDSAAQHQVSSAPPAAGWAGPGNLAVGSHGDNVRKLQARLNLLGQTPSLVVDGIFGFLTRGAVITYQTTRGLDADGIAGPITKGAVLTELRQRRVGDPRALAASLMHGDGIVTEPEAAQMVLMAQAESKLAPEVLDADFMVPALIALLVRAGVPLPGAQAAAPAILTLGTSGVGGAVVVDKSADLPTLTEAGKSGRATAIRAEAERSVLSNKARLDKWTLAEIEEDRFGFLRNMTQLDGNADTKRDQANCVGASMLGGVIMKAPAKLVKMAEVLLTEDAKKRFTPMQQSPVLESLQAMASGTFSPADGSVVAGGLVRSAQPEEVCFGLSTQAQFALVGRLRELGIILPEMRVDVYGTAKHRAGPHAMAVVDGTGYDPWAYEGAGGRATVVEGEEAAHQHGLHISDRLGLDAEQVKPGVVDPRARLDSMVFDADGNLILVRGVVRGKTYDPPLRAKYVFKDQKWHRVKPTSVPPDVETALPKTIGIEDQDILNPQVLDEKG